MISPPVQYEVLQLLFGFAGPLVITIIDSLHIDIDIDICLYLFSALYLCLSESEQRRQRQR